MYAEEHYSYKLTYYIYQLLYFWVVIGDTNFKIIWTNSWLMYMYVESHIRSMPLWDRYFLLNLHVHIHSAHQKMPQSWSRFHLSWDYLTKHSPRFRMKTVPQWRLMAIHDLVMHALVAFRYGKLKLNFCKANPIDILWLF